VLGSGIQEKVDDSVWQRWFVDPGYRSPTLVSALTRGIVLMSIDSVSTPDDTERD